MATENIYVPQEGALSALAGWLAGDLGGAVARLYDNAHVFNPTDTVADYNEAAFVGYAAQGALAWASPFTNGDGKAETDSRPCTWSFTAGSGTAVVFGIFLTDATGAKLLAVMPFLAAVTLTPTQPAINRQLQITDVSEL